MNETEALQWFDSLSGRGIKPGLGRITRLCELLGDPHTATRFIHVAGTNGKGSFCSMLSGILMHAGYKTGMFTSPFVTSVHEQIRLNGECIPGEKLAALFTQIRSFTDGMQDPPTSFEVLTAAALLYFQQSCCDFAVIECGMGGKLDSTNVITSPVAAVLMSVSVDHAAFLGDTTEKIAAAKCGIIKPGCFSVSYPEASCMGSRGQDGDAAAVFRSVCEREGVEWSVADFKGMEVLKSDLFSSLLRTDCGCVRLPFAGSHQIANFATVYTVVMHLRERGFALSDEDILRGVESAAMPARLEKLHEKPLVILDGGHNPGCAEAVSLFIRQKLSGKKITVLCALMKDKDFAGTLGTVLPLCDMVIFTKAKTERSEEPFLLHDLYKSLCNNAENCIAIEQPDVALTHALNITQPDGVLLICGSFYLAQSCRERFL